MEKIQAAIGVVTAGIFSTILAMWARFRFVKRSEFYDKSGRGLVVYRTDCNKLQENCIDRLDHKIQDLKDSQVAIYLELSQIKEIASNMGKSVAKIEQWIQDTRNNR